MKLQIARQIFLLCIATLSVFLLAGCGVSGNSAKISALSTLKKDATGVSVNTKISATFSEVMDPLSITATTFTLQQGTTAVAGGVSYSGVTAVFTPASVLLFNTTYTATITTGAKDLAGNALSNDYVWSFTTGVAPDTTPPVVSVTSPTNAAVDVPVNRQVIVGFSEVMDPATITAITFRMTGPGLTPVPGTVTPVGTSATFAPSGLLLYNTTYTVTITSGVKDLAGNPMASNFVFSFTTGAAADTIAPVVSFTSPANGSSAVAHNRKVNVDFSEAMDPLTITTVTFKMTGPGFFPFTESPVTGIVTSIGSTATFTPASNLAASTRYTVTITSAVKDLAGNPMVSDYLFSFTTSADPDITPPTVSVTSPTNSAVDVPVNRQINIGFSEAMDHATITALTLKVTGPGLTPVPGTITSVGTSATFIPLSNLANSTLYTVTVTSGVKDLAGNAMAANYLFTFTTGAAADIIAPTVSFTSPTNGAIAVPLNRVINVGFSEVMDPLTMTAITFRITGPGLTPVTGVVSYIGTTATFTPVVNLIADTLYTGTITTGAKDLAGNALAKNYVWSFTTGGITDVIAPTVLSTLPLNLATAVATNSVVSALFSEAMHPLTIATPSFTVKETIGGLSVAGTVTYTAGSNTGTFTPLKNFAFSTSYTATIKGGIGGVMDLAGNAMATDKIWFFSTADAPVVDTTRPTVLVVNPADLATGVAINNVVTATFSEPMDPATISTASIKVAGVVGTVSYTVSNNTATFTPSGNLANGTTYTATVTTGVTDLVGNALAGNKVWSFTTVVPPVALGAIAPFGGFGGGAGVTSQGTSTVITGDIGTTGVSTTITGLHDSTGDKYIETPLNIGSVTGRIYTYPPPPVIFGAGGPFGGNAATQVIADAAAGAALAAFNYLAGLPGGAFAGAGELGGLTLGPGTYTSALSFKITNGDLTLSGTSNDIWVFQMGSSLTVGAPGFPRSVTLIGGALPKNVFWQVGSAARIEDRCNMVGTIIASAGVTISTAGQVGITTLEGRALGLNASVTMVNTHINIPGP